jgi:hypothetical protein
LQLQATMFTKKTGAKTYYENFVLCFNDKY